MFEYNKYTIYIYIYIYIIHLRLQTPTSSFDSLQIMSCESVKIILYTHNIGRFAFHVIFTFHFIFCSRPRRGVNTIMWRRL